jgi:hypothetical protein
MKFNQRIKSVALAIVLVSIVFLGAECPPEAIVVEVGYDLVFTTSLSLRVSGTSVAFQPVPIQQFNFGGDFGVFFFEGLGGQANRIIRRSQKATADSAGLPSIATIPIQIIAMQLRTVQRLDLGAGVDFYYLTLSKTSPSTGTQTIVFNNIDGGTFTANGTLNLDIRKGALDGPIVSSRSIPVKTSDNVRWDRLAPSGALQIEGINLRLNARNRDEDFWPDDYRLIFDPDVDLIGVPQVPGGDDDDDGDDVFGETVTTHDQGGGGGN